MEANGPVTTTISSPPSSIRYSLRWNNFETSLVRQIDNLKSNFDFVDCSIRCLRSKEIDSKGSLRDSSGCGSGDLVGRNEIGVIKAHKLILAACSDYFKEIFKQSAMTRRVGGGGNNNHSSSGTMISIINPLETKVQDDIYKVTNKHESGTTAVQSIQSPNETATELIDNDHHTTVVISDADFIDIQNIIKYVYQGQVEIEMNRLQQFLKTAELLKIKGLCSGVGNSSEACNTDEQQFNVDLSPIPLTRFNSTNSSVVKNVENDKKEVPLNEENASIQVAREAAVSLKLNPIYQQQFTNDDPVSTSTTNLREDFKRKSPETSPFSSSNNNNNNYNKFLTKKDLNENGFLSNGRAVTKQEIIVTENNDELIIEEEEDGDQEDDFESNGSCAGGENIMVGECDPQQPMDFSQEVIENIKNNNIKLFDDVENMKNVESGVDSTCVGLQTFVSQLLQQQHHQMQQCNNTLSAFANICANISSLSGSPINNGISGLLNDLTTGNNFTSSNFNSMASMQPMQLLQTRENTLQQVLLQKLLDLNKTTHNVSSLSNNAPSSPLTLMPQSPVLSTTNHFLSHLMDLSSEHIAANNNLESKDGVEKAQLGKKKHPIISPVSALKRKGYANGENEPKALGSTVTAVKEMVSSTSSTLLKDEHPRKKWRCMQPRVCPYCSKTFSNSFNLKQHTINVHVVSTGVTCQICGKVVKNKWYLRKHLVTSHGAPLKKGVGGGNSNNKIVEEISTVVTNNDENVGCIKLEGKSLPAR